MRPWRLPWGPVRRAAAKRWPAELQRDGVGRGQLFVFVFELRQCMPEHFILTFSLPPSIQQTQTRVHACVRASNCKPFGVPSTLLWTLDLGAWGWVLGARDLILGLGLCLRASGLCVSAITVRLFCVINYFIHRLIFVWLIIRRPKTL